MFELARADCNVKLADLKSTVDSSKVGGVELNDLGMMNDSAMDGADMDGDMLDDADADDADVADDEDEDERDGNLKCSEFELDKECERERAREREWGEEVSAFDACSNSRVERRAGDAKEEEEEEVEGEEE